MELFLLFFVIILFKTILATIDINMDMFNHMANHLTLGECRKLVASLHNPAYKVSGPLHEESIIPDDAGCLNLLLKWNKEDGRGKSHVLVSRRLSELGRNDLAIWLSVNVANNLSEKFRSAKREEKRTRNTPDVEPKQPDVEPKHEEEHHEGDLLGEPQDEWTLVDTVLIILLGMTVAYGIMKWSSAIATALKNRGFLGKTLPTSEKPPDKEEEEPLTQKDQGN